MGLADVLAAPVRRMTVLVRWLPPDAAVWVDTPASWTLDRELAASGVEILGEVVRGLAALVAKRPSQIPPSIRIPRVFDRAEPSPAPKFDPIAFTNWLSMASSGGDR
jgi:hypothetical protein